MKMFTGIITDIGTVIEIDRTTGFTAKIFANYDFEGIKLGASIAHDGICLTVTDKGYDSEKPWYSVDISAETLSKTNVNTESPGWKIGALINLEKSLKVGDELGGHIVTGHVDGIAEVAQIKEDGDCSKVILEISQDLMPFIAQKGSVALNGTSLTVNEIKGKNFSVNLIPHTKNFTTWHATKKGDLINVEIDTLARYVARLKEMRL